LCFDRKMSFCCSLYAENLVKIQKKFTEMELCSCTDLWQGQYEANTQQSRFGGFITVRGLELSWWGNTNVFWHVTPCSLVKVFKVKSAVGAFYSTTALWLIVLLTLKGVPSFISRGAAHQRCTATSASEGRNYRWNLANNQVIHLNC
jgi:hypothetical protein